MIPAHILARTLVYISFIKIIVPFPKLRKIFNDVTTRSDPSASDISKKSNQQSFFYGECFNKGFLLRPWNFMTFFQLLLNLLNI